MPIRRSLTPLSYSDDEENNCVYYTPETEIKKFITSSSDSEFDYYEAKDELEVEQTLSLHPNLKLNTYEDDLFITCITNNTKAAKSSDVSIEKGILSNDDSPDKLLSVRYHNTFGSSQNLPKKINKHNFEASLNTVEINPMPPSENICQGKRSEKKITKTKAVRKKTKNKKDDSFIVSDSDVSSLDNSITIYHKVLAEKIRTDVKNILTSHKRWKNRLDSHKNSDSTEKLGNNDNRKQKIRAKRIICISSDDESNSEKSETFISTLSNSALSIKPLSSPNNLINFEKSLVRRNNNFETSLGSRNIDFNLPNSAQTIKKDDNFASSNISSEEESNDNKYLTPEIRSKKIICSSSDDESDREKLLSSTLFLLDDAVSPMLFSKSCQSSSEQLPLKKIDNSFNLLNANEQFVEKSKTISSLNAVNEPKKYNDYFKPEIQTTEKDFSDDASSFLSSEFQFTSNKKLPIEKKFVGKKNNIKKCNSSQLSTSECRYLFKGDEETVVFNNSHLLYPEAEKYSKKFKKFREELTKKLFKLFNEKVFENQLPEDMKIKWNARMTKTAGYCRNIKVKTVNQNVDYNGFSRTTTICLSTKVIDSPERLRDTLIHELCHAAVWLIDNCNDGHGHAWKSWTKKVRQEFPLLPPIETCHNYKIQTKYKYKCIQCGYIIGRHTKSLNLERICCGHCRGRFELLVHYKNDKTRASVLVSSTHVKPKPLTKFAHFVKENYGKVKNDNIELKHGDIMKMLSKNFKEMSVS